MKVLSTVKVVLESTDGNATLIFKRPRLNEQLKEEAPVEDSGAARVRKQCENAFKNLVDVQGLEFDDGSPVTVETIKNLDLDYSTVVAILTGYHEALGLRESAEKKDSASA